MRNRRSVPNRLSTPAGIVPALAAPGVLTLAAAALVLATFVTSPAVAGAGGGPEERESADPPLELIEVFSSAPVQFQPDGDPAADRGREVHGSTEIAPPELPHRILARVRIEPVPKDEVSVHDPWDRAGNVTLASPDGPDIELVKFVTSYGGLTEHEVDVTHLAPLLRGKCEFRAFVDTWLSPAWALSFSIAFVRADDRELLETNASAAAPDWVIPVLYEQDATAESLGADGLGMDVVIPDGSERVVLYYLSSGHCTDGRDDDEFVSKDNVISVDGVVVERFRPWRDDCERFRARNPYTRRWSDGWWSSDYSRSGWCPGDVVAPVKLDLTDHLTPGPHTIGFNVEGVRPRDEDDHYGYWRLSAYAVGWTQK